MGTPPITARYDGRVLVPDAPLDALPGTVYEIAPRRPSTPDEWKAFVDRTAGSWADFDEYEDPEDLPCDQEEPIV